MHRSFSAETLFLTYFLNTRTTKVIFHELFAKKICFKRSIMIFSYFKQQIKLLLIYYKTGLRYTVFNKILFTNVVVYFFRLITMLLQFFF